MIEVELTLQVQSAAEIVAIEPDDSDWTGPADLSLQQWQQWFEQWLQSLDPQLTPLDAYEVSLLLTTDAEIQRLNAAYRHQDAPTDVLAFAALEWEGPKSPLQMLPVNLGDIIVSFETATRQATCQNHVLATELAWLACHGLLHLLGWDHPSAERLDQMLLEQSRLMDAVGLKAPAWSSETLGYIG